MICIHFKRGWGIGLTPCHFYLVKIVSVDFTQTYPNEYRPTKAITSFKRFLSLPIGVGLLFPNRTSKTNFSNPIPVQCTFNALASLSFSALLGELMFFESRNRVSIRFSAVVPPMKAWVEASLPVVAPTLSTPCCSVHSLSLYFPQPHKSIGDGRNWPLINILINIIFSLNLTVEITFLSLLQVPSNEGMLVAPKSQRSRAFSHGSTEALQVWLRPLDPHGSHIFGIPGTNKTHSRVSWMKEAARWPLHNHCNNKPERLWQRVTNSERVVWRINPLL